MTSLNGKKTKSNNSNNDATTINCRNKFLEMMNFLEENCINMKIEVALILAAQLTGRPILLIGEPGCGKSFLSKLAASCYGDRDRVWFYQSIQPNTTSEEVFGGLIAEEYLKGVSTYNLEMGAANFEICILDEIFKCQNPDLLTKFLPFFDEESTIKSGGIVYRTKLKWSVLTSNELPDKGEHEALMNRINIKRWVQPLRGSDRLKALRIHGQKKQLLNPPKVDIADLKQARNEALRVEIPTEILNLICFDPEYEETREKAIANGLNTPSFDRSKALVDRLEAIGIGVSQRQLHQLCAENKEGSPSFLQAIAWLHGETEVTEEHLIWLTDCLWRVPEERDAIAKIINSLDDTSDIKKALQQIKDFANNYKTADYLKPNKDLIKHHMIMDQTIIQPIVKRLETVVGTQEKPKQLSSRAQKIVDEMKGILDGLLTNQEILQEHLQKSKKA